MIGSVLFFFYLAMCFTGLLSLILILTLMRHGSRQGEGVLRAGRRFMLADLLVGLFYFFCYYREMVLGQFHDGALLRCIDAVQFYVIALAWLSFIYAAAGSEAADPPWHRASRVVFPVLMVCSAAAYLILLDGYYQPVFSQSQGLLFLTEAALNLSVIGFTGVYVRHCFRHLTDPFERRFLSLVSILLIFNNIWNSGAVMLTLRQQLGESLLSSYIYAVTALALLAVNVLTIIFFYRRDFSPIFYAKAGQPLEEGGESLTEEQALDLLAEKHGLTRREREVLELAYQGMTNPQIAEALVISRYTVKRHMHNLFEKLQVQTRVELVHLVEERRR